MRIAPACGYDVGKISTGCPVSNTVRPDAVGERTDSIAGFERGPPRHGNDTLGKEEKGFGKGDGRE